MVNISALCYFSWWLMFSVFLLSLHGAWLVTRCNRFKSFQWVLVFVFNGITTKRHVNTGSFGIGPFRPKGALWGWNLYFEILHIEDLEQFSCQWRHNRLGAGLSLLAKSEKLSQEKGEGLQHYLWVLHQPVQVNYVSPTLPMEVNGANNVLALPEFRFPNFIKNNNGSPLTLHSSPWHYSN